MKIEKIILSFIAVLVGLLVAGIAFYLYQATKTIPPSKIKIVSIATPTPTLKPSIFLNLDKPKDEDVVNKKNVTVSGKTTSDAIVAILTPTEEQVITPAESGDFSTTVKIENGQNLIEVTAIAPNRKYAKSTRTVTFSTEEF